MTGNRSRRGQPHDLLYTLRTISSNIDGIARLGQRDAQEIGPFRIVFNHQHQGTPRGWLAHVLTGPSRVLLDCRQGCRDLRTSHRQSKSKRTPVAWGALYPNRASVPLDKLFSQRQPW